MISSKHALPALMVLVALLALGGWLLHRHSDEAASSGVSFESSKPAEPGTPATPLESVELAPAPGSRVESQPSAPEKTTNTAWVAEMRNSPLRAKMREYARVEKWEEKYASFKDEALRAERDSIEKQIEERVQPEMERRFARGAFEIVSTNVAYTGPPYNTCEVSWVRYDESKTWKKVTLPESGFEDVYKLKALSTWLGEYEHDRPALAARK